MTTHLPNANDANIVGSQPSGVIWAKENIADNLTLRAQLVNGAPEIGGVPEDDGRNGEIEPHSAVTDLSHLHPSHETRRALVSP